MGSIEAQLALFTLAAAFAVVTGANDGGALLTMGLRLPSLRPVGAIVVLVAGVAAAPMLFGVRVAQTFSRRLVAFQAQDGRAAFVVGLCAALAIVALLTRLGLPTSLTLALIGGIAGAGLGYALPVSWSGVAMVLAFGIAAPLVGGGTGYALARVLRWIPPGKHVPSVISGATLGGYSVQALAYGLNDGQKMLAVFGIVRGTGVANLHLGAASLIVIGCFFAVGVAASLRHLAGRLGRDLLVVRPLHTVSAELASSLAVFVSAGVGMPVSMTQSIAGALVGAGVSESSRRVRWRAVTRLVMAWFVTLPASVLLALATATTVRFLV